MVIMHNHAWPGDIFSFHTMTFRIVSQMGDINNFCPTHVCLIIGEIESDEGEMKQRGPSTPCRRISPSDWLNSSFRGEQNQFKVSLQGGFYLVGLAKQRAQWISLNCPPARIVLSFAPRYTPFLNFLLILFLFFSHSLRRLVSSLSGLHQQPLSPQFIVGGRHLDLAPFSNRPRLR